MNKLLALLFLVALSAAGADSLPYHPFRKLGTNYYDLRPLYTWQATLSTKTKAAARASGAAISAGITARTQDEIRNANAADARAAQASAAYRRAKESCPQPAWMPAGSFVVGEVWQPDMLLLQGSAGAIVLKNHPAHGQLVDGQPVQFFAVRTGNHQWTDRAGQTHTVPLYDYGIPYWPTNTAGGTKR